MTPDINMVGDMEFRELYYFPSLIPITIGGPLKILQGSEKREADRVIKQAYRSLGVKIPFFNREISRKKYQKVKNVDTVYAFGMMHGNHQQFYGHQGFSLQMALQLGKNVFAYDETTHQWYKGDTFQAHDNKGGFKEITRLKPCEAPTSHEKALFVIDPEPTEESRQEIQALWKR